MTNLELLQYLNNEPISSHTVYKTWVSIKTRCYNENSNNYIYYGARGIKLCSKWKDPKEFVKDMIGTWHKGLSIERLDNDKDYSPDNCVWATSSEQNSNQRARGAVKK